MDLNKECSMDYIKKSFELKNSKLYKEAIEMLYKALECEEGSENCEIISQIADLYVLLKNYDRQVPQNVILLLLFLASWYLVFDKYQLIFEQLIFLKNNSTIKIMGHPLLLKCKKH